MNPYPLIAPRTALAGLAFVVPFLVLNTIVARPIQPLLALLRPDGHSTPLEYALLATVLLLLPAGAFVALTPATLRPATFPRPPLANAAIAALLLGGFALVSFALFEDIYRCELLAIPNCD